MNSSYFNDLFSSIIGTYINYSNSIDLTQNQLVDGSFSLLNNSLFSVNSLGCLDIPFFCALITFCVLFYFFISFLRQVFSR